MNNTLTKEMNMGTQLTYDEMSVTQGGNFWDGFCVAVSVGRLVAPALAITGVGLGILTAATIGCLVYEVATLD